MVEIPWRLFSADIPLILANTQHLDECGGISIAPSGLNLSVSSNTGVVIESYSGIEPVQKVPSNYDTHLKFIKNIE